MVAVDPLGRGGGSLECERDDFLAKEREGAGDGGRGVEAEAGDEQRGADGNAAGAQRPATGGDGRGVPCGGIQGLVEEPSGKALDDGARAAEVGFAFLERQVEAPDERGLSLEGLAQLEDVHVGWRDPLPVADVVGRSRWECSAL